MGELSETGDQGGHPYSIVAGGVVTKRFVCHGENQICLAIYIANDDFVGATVPGRPLVANIRPFLLNDCPFQMKKPQRAGRCGAGD
ncbi:MAG: hypothetical protein FWC40_09955 [Proteobacteria bacterium]|nr:hypothetical protein [Pseudomonadota bacterium]